MGERKVFLEFASFAILRLMIGNDPDYLNLLSEMDF
jgi:hypothetical protein